MRKYVSATPLKTKLVAMMLLTSTTLLVAATAVFIANEAIAYRQAMRDELVALADIIGHNAASALLFDDNSSAAETIGSVSSNKVILSVCLLDRDQQLFALYQKQGAIGSFWAPDTAEAGVSAAQIPKLLASAEKNLRSYWDWDMRLNIARGIIVDGKTIGTVLVEADMTGLVGKLQRFVALVVLIMSAFLCVAYLMARKLQTLISQPIIHLAETMKAVSLTKDFSVQVAKSTDDEIGSLFDSFNLMLVELKERDELLCERQERLRQLAHFDNLTLLPNRLLFHDRLEQALLHAERRRQQMAIMFIDLDGFKEINDTHGHRVGDLVLIQVAIRLRNVVRGCDTVARMGGDEFTVFLQDIHGPGNAGVIAQKIVTELALPYDAHGKELFSSASIGIAMYPDDGETSDELLRRADMAMYHAKNYSKNTFKFYFAELDTQMRAQSALQHSLRKALERHEFEVHYQPVVAIDSGRVVGVEALVRWRHPEQGLIMPDAFIPIAEKSDLIHGLGRMVLHEACQRVKSLQDQGFPLLRVAVNVSPYQFRCHQFDGIVLEVLLETGLNPNSLELEITEGAIMHDVEASITTMSLLKAKGVRISIDDFGVGYSSLNYLRRFPIDTLKIDRSFVVNMATCNEDLTIVSTIIAMAHSLNFEVIAEGVESEAQVALLAHLGCQAMQGYLLSRPQPSEFLPQLLAAVRVVPPAADPLLKSVLVVDDDIVITTVISTILVGQGYRVVTADDGIDGFRKVITHNPDVIISDRFMPHSDGFALLYSLKALDQIRSIPVILISSQMTPKEEAEALDRGFFDFIAKPINSSILVARVRRAVQFAARKWEYGGNKRGREAPAPEAVPADLPSVSSAVLPLNLP